MAGRPFPVPNSTTSFWRTQVHPLDTHRSTEKLPTDADIVIIGGGYAGASVAHHLLNNARSSICPSSIVMLEAREACSGATGRNGGHLKPDPYMRAAEALKLLGKEAADEVALFETKHLKEIGDLVKRETIDCDFKVTKVTDVFLYESGAEQLKAKLDSLSTAGVPGIDDVSYSDHMTAEIVSSVKGAIACATHTTGHLYPYKLVMHLLEKVVAQGVNLQTNTPVESVASHADPSGRWSVVTGRGTIKAQRVVFATNGYTSALIPGLHNKIVPVRGICSRIVSPRSHNQPLSTASVIRFNDDEYDYLIPRSDGSIVVGGARRDYYTDLDSWFNCYDDSALIDSAKNYFDGYMQRHFVGWEDSEAYTDQVWTGIMGYSDDGFPYVGDIPGRQGCYIVAGFTGHGMSQAFLSAKAVATMIVEGTESKNIDLPRLYRSTRDRFESKHEHVSLTAFNKVIEDLKRRK